MWRINVMERELKEVVEPRVAEEEAAVAEEEREQQLQVQYTSSGYAQAARVEPVLFAEAVTFDE